VQQEFFDMGFSSIASANTMVPEQQQRFEDACQAVSENLEGLIQAIAVVRRLRHPEEGCPWDLKQSHASLRKYMLEEAYEAVEAMEANEATPHLQEELGDVLLQVLLHAQIAEDNGAFTVQDVAAGLAEKLIRRHPHVFAPHQETAIHSPEAVTAQWQAIKAQEQAQKSSVEPAVPVSVLQGVGQGKPALMRAGDISHKAVKVGFAWPDDATLMGCVRSELDEIETEMQASPRQPERLEDEMGDVLFACASLARHIGVEPEVALHKATGKFECRFRHMEQLIQQAGLTLGALSFDEWEAFWQQAKTELRALGACL
jgi:nucleoside triphosphate diphosphatase